MPIPITVTMPAVDERADTPDGSFDHTRPSSEYVAMPESPNDEPLLQNSEQHLNVASNDTTTRRSFDSAMSSDENAQMHYTDDAPPYEAYEAVSLIVPILRRRLRRRPPRRPLARLVDKGRNRRLQSSQDRRAVGLCLCRSSTHATLVSRPCPRAQIRMNHGPAVIRVTGQIPLSSPLRRPSATRVREVASGTGRLNRVQARCSASSRARVRTTTSRRIGSRRPR